MDFLKQSATAGDVPAFTSDQKVAGSSPAGRASFPEQNRGFALCQDSAAGRNRQTVEYFPYGKQHNNDLAAVNWLIPRIPLDRP